MARYFPPASKARAQEMVSNIIAAFRDRIDSLDWMAPATKQEAKAKLAVLKVGVGYPDKWPSYSGLQIVKRAMRSATASGAELFEYRRSLAQAGQARGPGRVGHDAADRQRGEPAGA